MLACLTYILERIALFSFSFFSFFFLGGGGGLPVATPLCVGQGFTSVLVGGRVFQELRDNLKERIVRWAYVQRCRDHTTTCHHWRRLGVCVCVCGGGGYPVLPRSIKAGRMSYCPPTLSSNIRGNHKSYVNSYTNPPCHATWFEFVA